MMFLLILPLICIATGLPHHSRIVGGQDATSGQFPFMVALNDPDQFCDGSIVAPSWILTAAQCLYHISPKSEVLVGTHRNLVGGTRYQIVQRIVHEDYDATTLKNDIGLIRIDGVLEYGDTIQPIGIGAVVGTNATCTAIGWGASDDETWPENLQYVELTVIDMDLCQILSADLLEFYLGLEQVCSLGVLGKGACLGDSGGPLVCDGNLAGIVSYSVGFECGSEIPDVYTNVAVYADWIQARIQG